MHYCTAHCRFNDNAAQKCEIANLTLDNRRCQTYRARGVNNYPAMMKSAVPPYHATKANSMKVTGVYR